MVRKHIIRFFVLWLILGMMYAQLELFARGYTYVQMTFIGGLVGISVGALNQHSLFIDRKMWMQSLIGTFLTLTIEFSSGMIFNVWLKMNLWNYSGKLFNLYGQICLQNAILWFLLMPFAIWADDYIRYKFFDQNKPAGVISNYIRLFTLT